MMMFHRQFTDRPLVPPRHVNKTADQTIITDVIGHPVLTAMEVEGNIPVHINDSVEINRIINACTRQIEDYIKQDVVKKKVKCYAKRFDREFRLPRGPHGDILSIVITDENGFEKTLSDSQYDVRGITYKTIYDVDEHGEITVEFESGYEHDQIPPQIPQAIMQEINLQYKNRQDPDTPGMTSHKNLSLESRHLLSGLMRGL